MEADKIRVGIIGVGGIAQGHIGRLLGTHRVEIPAICDISEEMIERTNQHHPRLAGKWRVYDEYKKMLRDEELDAVNINTPHTLHFEQITAALRRDLHVLAEKPMVCTVEHAEKIVRAARRRKRVVMVSYQRHFQPAYRYVREQIGTGKHGPVHFISALQSQDWVPITKLWRGDPALSGGGQLNDSGSHLIDIILWMTELEPAEVHAYMDNRGTRVDILSAVNARFTNGALCNISVVGDSVTWHEDISIWCERAAFFIRGPHVIQADPQERIVDERDLPKGWDPDTNFVRAIFGEEEPQTPPECGLRVIQLTEAAWKSGKSGKPVKVRAAKPKPKKKAAKKKPKKKAKKKAAKKRRA
ncbi:MAG: Gfo/Idh/MocA family oxidoreductase [Armatimonadota bacterium]|jgi:predicted dehydrogenase